MTKFRALRVASLVLTMVFAVLLQPANASELTQKDSDAAKAFIVGLGDTAIGALTGENISDQEREQRFKSLFADNFNTTLIARFVLGRHWRGASEEERRNFQGLFEQFMVSAYANRFKDYSGEDFVVEGAAVKKRDIWVDSKIVRADAGAPAVRIRWRVRPLDEAYKIIDVVVEGISMSITQRDEFSSVIQSSGGTVAALNDQLRKRITQ